MPPHRVSCRELVPSARPTSADPTEIAGAKAGSAYGPHHRSPRGPRDRGHRSGQQASVPRLARHLELVRPLATLPRSALISVAYRLNRCANVRNAGMLVGMTNVHWIAAAFVAACGRSSRAEGRATETRGSSAREAARPAVRSPQRCCMGRRRRARRSAALRSASARSRRDNSSRPARNATPHPRRQCARVEGRDETIGLLGRAVIVEMDGRYEIDRFREVS